MSTRETMNEDAYRTTISLLAIDVGEINTRAVLFDLVEARYRFLAIGSAPTSLQMPHYHAGEGIRQALLSLEQARHSLEDLFRTPKADADDVALN